MGFSERLIERHHAPTDKINPHGQSTALNQNRKEPPSWSTSSMLLRPSLRAGNHQTSSSTAALMPSILIKWRRSKHRGPPRRGNRFHIISSFRRSNAPWPPPTSPSELRLIR